MSTDAKETARDIIATRFFERGHDQGYRVADRLIMNLYSGGFDIVRRDHLAGNMEELNRQEITIDTLRIDVERLRAALSALIDASEKAEIVWAYGGNGEGWSINDVMEELGVARAAAVSVLQGEPEGEI